MRQQKFVRALFSEIEVGLLSPSGWQQRAFVFVFVFCFLFFVFVFVLSVKLAMKKGSKLGPDQRCQS